MFSFISQSEWELSTYFYLLVCRIVLKIERSWTDRPRDPRSPEEAAKMFIELLVVWPSAFFWIKRPYVFLSSDVNKNGVN